MTYYEYFPQELIDLQQELAQHPDAVAHMLLCDSKYMEDRLAHLCTFLDILVDDEFDIDELCDLATMVTRALYKRRTGLVITH